MAAAIGPLLWVIFIVFIVSKSKNKTSGNNGRNVPRRQNFQAQRAAFEVKKPSEKAARPVQNPFSDKEIAGAPTKVQPQHGHKLGNLSAVLEDRNNDWLAKQLREEARHKNDYR